MVFKSFRVSVVGRIVLLCITIYIFFYLILNTNYYATLTIIGIFSVIQILALIKYVEKTNTKLSQFLDAVKSDDFSQSYFIDGLGSSFDDLKESFSKINKHFRKTRFENEENFRYLQTVVQHIGVPLIVYDQQGTVELLNKSAKQLLKISAIKNIDSLNTFSRELVNTLHDIKPKEKKILKVYKEGEIFQLALHATKFRMRQNSFTVVSLQNIQSELEEKETEAWQSLIRVLTHEIMNSITPISSLSQTISEILPLDPDRNDNQPENSISTESLKDIREAIDTIGRRSEGLLHFVDKYRDLTKIPVPEFSIISINELFKRIENLLEMRFQDKSVILRQKIDPVSLELTADMKLVEQILINLILNAIDALDGIEQGIVELNANINPQGRIVIQVKDNGTGMSPDLLEKIFIPFYTTKKVGSGIGLSLSRQIMRLHGGNINARSEVNKGTTIALSF